MTCVLNCGCNCGLCTASTHVGRDTKAFGRHATGCLTFTEPHLKGTLQMQLSDDEARDRNDDPDRECWVPIDNDEAAEIIGEGLHTGLRKGTEAPEAHDLWTAIAASEGAWNDALAYLIDGLNYMGYKLCTRVAP